MAKIEKFEDIEAWKKARELTKEVYESTRHGAFTSDFGLRDQIRRAAVSVMSNIAEGFNRGGNKEFVQFRQGKEKTSQIAKNILKRLNEKEIHIDDVIKVLPQGIELIKASKYTK